MTRRAAAAPAPKKGRRRAKAAPPGAAPPPLSYSELSVVGARPGEQGVDKLVRFAHPAGWTADESGDDRSMRLVGPSGEGEIFVGAALHPAELGEYLTQLKRAHPSTAPSPPQAIDVAGIVPERGERATRFVLSGREAGELVMIERGGVILLFATLVSPEAWEKLEPTLRRCYPSVRVTDSSFARSPEP